VKTQKATKATGTYCGRCRWNFHFVF